MNNKRTTPEQITTLKENEVFVFGSNLAGRHGLGAAKTALQWGAVYGQGVGFYGQTYAIPTKDWMVRETLPVSEIKKYVDDFIDFAIENKDKTFLVTAIGCGLAGLKSFQIAPLFIRTIEMNNVYLPKNFREELEKDLRELVDSKINKTI